jgi:hypothetical protein
MASEKTPPLIDGMSSMARPQLNDRLLASST